MLHLWNLKKSNLNNFNYIQYFVKTLELSSAPLNLSLCKKKCETCLVPTVRVSFLLRVISDFITLLPPEMKSGLDLRVVFPQEENFKGAAAESHSSTSSACVSDFSAFLVKCASWFDRDHSMQWQCHQLWTGMPRDRWRVCVRLSWRIFTTGQWSRLHWYGL